MGKLIVLVFGMTFFVDFLLILGTNRLLGYPPGLPRAMVAAMISAIFSAACLTPAFSFLGNGIWRIIGLGVIIATAFGASGGGARLGLRWLLLKFALNGVANAFGSGGFGAVLLALGAAGILYGLGFPSGCADRELIPVELNYRNRQWKLTALRDTGNTLRDPITGERVLVAGADMGQKLLGLTAGQLSAPADTLAAGLAPGMRLIPYRTVGQRGAMMLALRLRDVKVGTWQGSALVAFAPECFGNRDGYQMLVGGTTV